MMASRISVVDRHAVICFTVLCALFLIPQTAAAQPGAKCKAIAPDIADLKLKKQSLTAELGTASPDQKPPIAAMIKKLNAQISAKELELKNCLAMASTSGGEPFTMQGGVFLTSAQIAQTKAICIAPLPPPAPPQPPPSNTLSPPPTKSWMAPSCAPIGFQKANVSDAQVAASSTHVIVTFENSMAWYDKSGEKQKELRNFDLFYPLLTTLGSAVGMSNESNDCLKKPNISCARAQSDFRVIFDEYRKRFWVVDGAGVYPATKTPPGTGRGILLVAVSKSEDPKDGWYLYWMDAVAHWGKANDKIFAPGDGGDAPTIGVDPSSFHLTNFVSDVNGKPKYHHVAFFRADDNKAINGIPPAGWHYYDLQNPDGSPTSLIQPAVHHGATGRAYYVSWYRDDEVLVWALSSPLQATQKMERVEVKLVDGQGQGVPFIPPVNAPQKNDGSRLIEMTNFGNNILKAVYRGGLLYFVANDAQDWFQPGKFVTSIRLVRLPVFGFPNIPTLGNAFYINRRFGKNGVGDMPQDQVYYGWPAVEVNKNGDMVIVYARSGLTLYPEVHYSVYFGAEADIRKSRVLQRGGSVFGSLGVNRWGDIAGAAVDPEDDTGIWIAQQYANAAGSWDMWVGKIFGK